MGTARGGGLWGGPWVGAAVVGGWGAPPAQPPCCHGVWGAGSAFGGCWGCAGRAEPPEGFWGPPSSAPVPSQPPSPPRRRSRSPGAGQGARGLGGAGRPPGGLCSPSRARPARLRPPDPPRPPSAASPTTEVRGGPVGCPPLWGSGEPLSPPPPTPFVQGPATSPRATMSPSRSWRSPRARSCPLPSPRCALGGSGVLGTPGHGCPADPTSHRCPSATASAPERNRSAKPSRAAARRRLGRWGGPGAGVPVPPLGGGRGSGLAPRRDRPSLWEGIRVPSWPCQGTAPLSLAPWSPRDLGCSGGLCHPAGVQGLTLCPPGHVQAGAAADPRRHPHHHPQIQEHPVRHLQTRRLQEPRVRHLHRLWGGQGGLGGLCGGRLPARGWPW